jgi:hypothetical protein
MDRNFQAPQSDNQGIPQKTCIVCGRTIQWRRRRAANWDTVRYCTASCRREAVAAPPSATEAERSAAA